MNDIGDNHVPAQLEFLGIVLVIIAGALIAPYIPAIFRTACKGIAFFLHRLWNIALDQLLILLVIGILTLLGFSEWEQILRAMFCE